MLRVISLGQLGRSPPHCSSTSAFMSLMCMSAGGAALLKADCTGTAGMAGALTPVKAWILAGWCSLCFHPQHMMQLGRLHHI